MSYAPDTLTRPAEWRAKAACLGHLNIFFPVTEDARSAEAARAVCAQCPVRPRCLAEAMLEERNEDEHRRAGVRGGLTPAERARLSRRVRNTPPGQGTPLIAEVQARQERTPASVFENRSVSLGDGHREWRGSSPVTVNNASYTPRQLAWYVEHSKKPGGRLQQLCDHKGCVTAKHMQDPGPTPTGCGTRSGYQAHRARGEEACRECKNSNTDADRRLRNTGTTKQLTA